MEYTYKTKGTCAVQTKFDLDGDIISNVKFLGGCNGNLQGISRLVEGMNVNDVATKLKGITCGYKSTSCPDQLAIAIANAVAERKQA